MQNFISTAKEIDVEPVLIPIRKEIARTIHYGYNLSKNVDKLNFFARVVPVLHTIYKKIIKRGLSWLRLIGLIMVLEAIFLTGRLQRQNLQYLYGISDNK